MTHGSIARVFSFILCVMSATACLGQQRPVWELDVTRGTEVHRGVLGHTWEFQLQSPLNGHATVMRGVAGGLAAENFDWRRVAEKQSGGKWGSTLRFLRECRDQNWGPLITVNIRGLLDPNKSGHFGNVDPEMLAQLAADWVRYCNYILPTYRRGDTITSADDRRIIESISWEGEQVLLEPGEANVPRVQRWELGNEPSAFAGNLPGGAGPHVFTHRPDDYVQRYQTISRAMIKADSAIKVGPCFADDFRDLAGKPFVMALLRSDARIDFLSYHKYAHLMHGWPDDGIMLGTLQELRREMDDRHARCVAAIAAAGRDPASIELALTEYNAASWGVNSVQLSMARALGTSIIIHQLVEKGYQIATHWDRLAFDGAPWPTALLMQRLVSDLGSVAVGRYRDQTVDLIATRQSGAGDLIVWGFNLDPRESQRVTLRIPAISSVQSVEHSTLGATQGKTMLQSRNTPAEPSRVAWSKAVPVEAGGRNVINLDIPAMSVRQWRIRASMPEVEIVPQNYPKPATNGTTVPAATTKPAAELAGDLKAATDLAAKVAEGAVRLTWKGGQGRTQFIERCDDEIDFLQIAQVDLRTTTFTDSKVEPNGRYQYRIVTRSADGRSIYSSTTTATVGASKSQSVASGAAGAALSDARLVAHWPFNHAHQLADLKKPNAKQSAFGGAKIETVDGREALLVPKGGYVSLDEAPVFPIGPGHEGSIAFWIRTTAQRGVILAKNESHDAPAAYEYGIMLDSPGRTRWMSAVHVRGFKTQIGASDKPISDGAWHHVVITFQGSTGRFYVDGEPRGVFHSLEQNVTMRHSLLIGANRTWRPDLINPGTELAIADLRFYAHALSPAALTQLAADKSK